VTNEPTSEPPDDGSPNGTQTQHMLRFWRLYEDDAGVSHFKEGAAPFAPIAIPGLDDPPLALTFAGGSGTAFLRLAPRQVEDWHPSPRKTLLVVIKGASRVTAGDGTVKEFHPGDVVLMEDMMGKGHITEPAGDGEHIALIIPIESFGD
jgi:hypothetical protein